MKASRVANAYFIVGMAAAIAGFFVPASAARGWLWLCGFGSFAIHNVWVASPGQPRRLGFARGLFMLLMAVVLSGPYLWPQEPAWLKEALPALSVVFVLWILVEQKKSISVGGSLTAPLLAPPSRSRLIWVGLFVVFGLLAPPLYFWLRK